MTIRAALLALLTAALCGGIAAPDTSAGPAKHGAPAALSAAPARAATAGERVRRVSTTFMKAVYAGRKATALRVGTRRAWREARADHRRGDRFRRGGCLRHADGRWQDWWPRARWMCRVRIDYAGVDYDGAIGLFLARRDGRWIVREYFRIAG